MARLEDLQSNTVVRGILPDCSVTLVTLQWFGSTAVEITFKDPAGRVANRLLYRDDEPTLEIVELGRPWSFDGDGQLFRLVSEAQRIRLAHLFDPLLAVHTSLVEPLPHQITAVYEAMLPRQPLRYLLADDPGAGKTIMSGLLIKELRLTDYGLTVGFPAVIKACSTLVTSPTRKGRNSRKRMPIKSSTTGARLKHRRYKTMTDFLEQWAKQSEANTKLVAQETLITEVTEEIWKAMEEAGINKAELARKLGATKGYITQVLNGSRNMTLRTLSDICFALDRKPSFYLEPKETAEEWDTEQNQDSGRVYAELS